MERQRFDDSWKESFKDSEVSPSESLWTNIELDLEKAEGHVMRRRVLFFKLLAAASVAFAMTFAGVGVYFVTKKNSDSLADQRGTKPANQAETINPAVEQNAVASPVEENTAREKDPSSVNSASEKSSADIQVADNSNKNNKDVAKSGDNDQSNQPDRNNSLKQPVSDHQLATLNSTQQKSNIKSNSVTKINSSANDNKTVAENGVDNSVNQSGLDAAVALNEESNNNRGSEEDVLHSTPVLPSIVRLPQPTLPSSVTPEVDPVSAMMARFNAREQTLAKGDTKEKKDEKKNSSERVWTSVGFAAGSFSTVTSGTPSVSANVQPSQLTLSNTVVQNQSSAAGKAYTVGISVGGKVSERWVLQGGVNYLTQSSEYTTNAIIGTADYASFKAASIADISNAAKDETRLVSSASYNVNSSLQYISVPLQAGYMILNRGLGIQLNAGVSTDLFIQNTLTPEGGSLEKSTQGNGSDSPYRPVNFSGLVGTELSYRFSHRYRIAINPGIRYPFSSIYKSDIELNANPLTFDVGLRFRYIFN